MQQTNWQLEDPVSAVIFDCDGTLTQVEGIDELAKSNGVGQPVIALTEEAMGQSGLDPSLYEKRLKLIQPNLQQVKLLAESYIKNIVTDASNIISILQNLGKSIYVISAGLTLAVQPFAKSIGVDEANVFAVKTTFDPKGCFIDFDKSSPLIHNHGKRDIIAKLKQKHKRLIFIGDGLNDIAAHDLVTRFIGYGGYVYRENIAEKCLFYIKTKSLSPVLPLVLTKKEKEKLIGAELKIYNKGQLAILNNEVIIRCRP